MKADIFDGYTVSVAMDEDREYIAHFMELPTVSAFGKTPEHALHELEQAWELMKEDYRAS